MNYGTQNGEVRIGRVRKEEQWNEEGEFESMLQNASHRHVK